MCMCMTCENGCMWIFACWSVLVVLGVCLWLCFLAIVHLQHTTYVSLLAYVMHMYIYSTHECMCVWLVVYLDVCWFWRQRWWWDWCFRQIWCDRRFGTCHLSHDIILSCLYSCACTYLYTCMLMCVCDYTVCMIPCLPRCLSILTTMLVVGSLVSSNLVWL